MTVAVIPTGTANTASVFAALRRIGAEPAMATSPDHVVDARRVVLPGVGAFGAAMAEIEPLREALTDRIGERRPTLAVCVGMQLLAEKSAESVGVAGLGVIGDSITRFPSQMVVPQLGWNQVEPEPGARLLEPGWAYFANSYRLSSIPDGWTGAITDYGGVFVSGIESGDVLACQFHPELSGEWGSRLLQRWYDSTRGSA